MEKINNYFTGIEFLEESHQYFINNEEYKPVSTYLSEFVKPFDEQFFSNKIAIRDNKTQQQVLKEWALKRDTACEFGSYCHEELEKYAIETYLPHNVYKPLSIDMGMVDLPVALKLIEQGKQWLAEMHSKGYKLVATELMMFDKTKKICGTCDLLFFKDGKYVLADWKTNRSHAMDSRAYGRMFDRFSYLQDNSLGKYSAQLTVYKEMLEQVVPVSDEMIIVHLTESGTKLYNAIIPKEPSSEELLPLDFLSDFNNFG